MTAQNKARRVAIKVTRDRNPEPRKHWMVIRDGIIVTAENFDWWIQFLAHRYPGCFLHYFSCDSSRPEGLVPFEKGGRFIGTEALIKAEKYLKKIIN